ncbi:hypothetical protein KIPB_015222, partial [Kipferlia bialata]
AALPQFLDYTQKWQDNQHDMEADKQSLERHIANGKLILAQLDLFGGDAMLEITGFHSAHDWLESQRQHLPADTKLIELQTDRIAALEREKAET